MNIELIIIIFTMIIGFLGITIAILQINNNLRVEFRGQLKEIKAEITETRKEGQENFKALSARIDKTNTDLSVRIDAVNSRLDSLYRELFRKDAA